jgi:hypothetical protein
MLERVMERVKVLAGAAVTWLVAVSIAISVAAPQIAELFPESAEDITAWAARVVGWLAVAVTIARRVSPVPADERGLLPTAIETRLVNSSSSGAPAIIPRPQPATHNAPDYDPTPPPDQPAH